jgi:site-specific DNA recombinase
MTEATRTAILYARVSTRAQSEEGYSLRQQVATLRQWAEAEGYEVLEAVEEPGQSGASLERPGLDRVRDRVAEGGVSVVLAQDRDRFAREPAYLFLLKREFEAHGTKLRALNDRGDGSPEGDLTDGILDQLAKFERAKMVERSRRGKNRMVSEGKVVRGPRPPFGFLYDQHGDSLIVEPTQMAVVRRVFEMLAVEGLTLGEVARRLNGDSIPSPMASNTKRPVSGKWSVPTIRTLVKNPLYRPLSTEEIVASMPVLPEVARSLDPKEDYGLWTWNKRHQRMWRERSEDGEHRDRYQMVPRPKDEWLGVPIPLSDAGLSRAHVDAARERIEQNGGRRPPSTAAHRFWQLSGGIVRCDECGSVLSPTARRRPNGKIDSWYMCRQRYNSGRRDCTSGRFHRADVLEESVWRIVYGFLSDPQRLVRQYEAHVQDQRRQMREDPDKEVRDLHGRLQKLDQKESYLLDMAADTSMPRESLQSKLAQFDQQRKVLRNALREAEARQDALRRPRENLANFNRALLQMNRMKLSKASPEDRRRVYQALQLQATVDRDGNIRLSGIFDPDVYLPGVLRDPPTDPSTPLPRMPKGIKVQVITPCAKCVTTSNTRRATPS